MTFIDVEVHWEDLCADLCSVLEAKTTGESFTRLRAFVEDGAGIEAYRATHKWFSNTNNMRFAARRKRLMQPNQAKRDAGVAGAIGAWAEEER